MTDMQTFTDSLYGDSYLEHHGIKGMKWGVRRTPEQLGHKKKSEQSEDYKRSREYKKRGTDKLSNRELQELNTRLRLEQEYNNLNQASANAGRKKVNAVLKNSGYVLAASIEIADKLGLDSAKISEKTGLNQQTVSAIMKGVQIAGIVSSTAAKVTESGSAGKKKKK